MSAGDRPESHPALLPIYEGHCPHCDSDNHIPLTTDEHECWNCFRVFTIPDTNTL